MKKHSRITWFMVCFPLHLRGRRHLLLLGPVERANLSHSYQFLKVMSYSQSQSYVTTDSQSASQSWCQAPILDSRPIFSVLSLIILRQLQICLCGCPLWGEVWSVVFSFSRASVAQPFSGLSPTVLMSIFYCLYFWDSPNLEGQAPVFIFPRNRAAQLYPQALGLSN
jgi:hypothetical protein